MVKGKVIGIDFGTLSARAVVVDTADGHICGQAEYKYPHGVMTAIPTNKTPLPSGYALAYPEDYRQALINCVHQAMDSNRISPDEIIAIGVDATSYSMVPCWDDTKVMCELKQYSDEPMAYIKLWKHKGTQSQANKIAFIQSSYGAFTAIEHYGGKVNCEMALPKLLETYEKSPQLFRDTRRFCDLGEWITAILTGKYVNSYYSLGFKGFWTPEQGIPDNVYLDMLAPGFAAGLQEKYWGEPLNYSGACGTLTEESAEILELNAGIPVSTPIGDGSSPGVIFCINAPKTLAITYGTSIAMSFASERLAAISGINGVVKGGFIPDVYCYDAGQPCCGDMLGWFINNNLPAEYFRGAKANGTDIHSYLSMLASNKQPWNNSLVVLDWWNGNRGILNDMELTGAIIGYTLDTQAEDIYCAMLQGIACGSRKIIQHFKENGIDFDRIIVCGGIAEKNDFAMQQYANILNCDILIPVQNQITARGTAILAAIAAGIDADTVSKNMSVHDFKLISPDMEHATDYEKIYRRWEHFHDLLGGSSGN